MGINTKSVRFRTTMGAVLALVSLLIVAFVIINWFVGRQVEQSFDNVLVEQASDRAALYTNGAPVESLISVVGDEAIVVVIDQSNEIVASAGTPSPEDVVDLPVGVHDAMVTIVERGESPHRESLRVGVVQSSDGSRFVVGNEGEAASDTRSAVRRVLLIVTPLVALAGATIAWFVTGWALRPVKAMQRDLNEVSTASDGQRVRRPETNDEIDELGGTINDVLDRLDAHSLARRQFVADASHELKSPLANARAIIETSDPAPHGSEQQRVTGAVSAELNRMHSLVDDLLYMAREDEAAPSEPRATDLADVAFDEAERLAVITDKTIDGSGLEPVSVMADPFELARAIRNLIENAARFASTTITLAITTDDETATFIVGDDGPGIAAADRDRIFERFTRVDTDRARSAGGTGLGLAIVASIAARNGGSVRATTSPSGGAQFELTLRTS